MALNDLKSRFTRKKKVRRGLVLSGGAALGAYQAGVVRALHAAGLEFEIISATSIGTINGMAWNIPDILEELDQHWIENVSRLKPFDISRLMRGKNPFQFHATLDNITENYGHRYPFENQRAEVLVSLASFDTNETVVISSADETLSRDDRERAMKASTAILHIGSSPVEINGRKYYDGGYNNNVPIDPLLEYDFDEIWIVPLSPIGEDALRKRRDPAVLTWAKRQISQPYIHSIFNVLEQSMNPPFMHIGRAEKFIISPFNGSAREHINLATGFVFSLENVVKLLDAGFKDGEKTTDAYYRAALKS